MVKYLISAHILVCDNLDYDINIGLAILKQLNINIYFSNNGPITFDFDSDPKQWHKLIITLQQ